jgi:hypothetical protein
MLLELSEKCSLTNGVLLVLPERCSLTNLLLLGFSEKCSSTGFIRWGEPADKPDFSIRLFA